MSWWCCSVRVRASLGADANDDKWSMRGSRALASSPPSVCIASKCTWGTTRTNIINNRRRRVEQKPHRIKYISWNWVRRWTRLRRQRWRWAWTAEVLGLCWFARILIKCTIDIAVALEDYYTLNNTSNPLRWWVNLNTIIIEYYMDNSDMWL